MRDFLLTLLMWIAVRDHARDRIQAFFRLLFARGLVWASSTRKANWPLFFERLTPFLLTTGVLVYLLTAAGILTLRRRRLALLRPPPAPLDLATECREAGLNETTLLAARSARIVVVHIGSQGNVEIEIQRART